MNRSIKSGYLIVVLLLISVLLGACGSVVTPTPVAPSTDSPPSQPEPEKPSEYILPEPDAVQLKVADFNGVIVGDKISDMPVFFGTGSLINDSGETLLINVIGSSEDSIKRYFESAQFYFEIREPIDIPIIEEKGEEIPPLSNGDLFKDTEMEYLLIDFDIPPETYDKYPKGTLFVIIDPIVRQNQYNNYGLRNPASDRVDVTITASQGQVEGTLYLECRSIWGQTKRALPGTPKTLTGTGAGDFDLTIKGINAGDNKYRLTGAWNYDYNVSVLSELITRITC